jgi:lantibiotic biosynthesis protein
MVNPVAAALAARILALPPPASGDLYEGAAGPAVFFAELARQDPAYRAAALRFTGQASTWAATNARLPGFHGGAAGAHWAVHRASWLLHTPAPPLALPPPIPGRGDIVAGEAGTLLAFTALGLRTEAGDLVRRIHASGGDTALGRAWPAEHPATGLAHGAAGVAWALLEADPNHPCPHEGFLFERAWFDRQACTWRSNQPPHAPVSLSWCHGLAGIALTRLRAFALTGRPEYGAEAAIAATGLRASAERVLAGHSTAWEEQNHSLCHGLGGAVDALLYAGEILADESYTLAAQRLWAAAIDAGTWLCGTEKQTPDPGFMLGYAGMGLLALRVDTPQAMPPLGLWPAGYSISE